MSPLLGLLHRKAGSLHLLRFQLLQMLNLALLLEVLLVPLLLGLLFGLALLPHVTEDVAKLPLDLLLRLRVQATPVQSPHQICSLEASQTRSVVPTRVSYNGNGIATG